MSEISDAIQAKCLAFGDRIIKLNDYLLEQAASKRYDGGSQRADHHTSDISAAKVQRIFEIRKLIRILAFRR